MALEYNKLTAEEGFEVFDSDGDGKVSLSDLSINVEQFQLELEPEKILAFFLLAASGASHMSTSKRLVQTICSAMWKRHLW